jgi:hypothetical protein
MTVLPNGPFAMGRSLALWFVYLLVVSYATAYACCHAPAAGAVPHVRRLAAVVAFLGYAGALWHDVIWFRRSWVTAAKSTVDAVVYAVITAATFHWLWPR